MRIMCGENAYVPEKLQKKKMANHGATFDLYNI